MLELKDKVGAIETGSAPTLLQFGNNSPDKDALEALVALGIGRAVAEAALRKTSALLPPEATVEERIKQTLKSI